MAPHQIVAVALRLFAVWLGIAALRTLPAFFAASASEAAPGYVYALCMLALTAVLVLALWFFPRTIAGKILPSHDTQSQPSATPDTWLAMGCTLIGLWTLTTAIPELVYNFFALSAMSMSQRLPWVLYNMVELVIALWLVLGGKGVSKIFWWAQNAGIRKDL